MFHTALRIFLVLALLAVAVSYVESGAVLSDARPYLIIGAVVLAALVIATDMTIPRKTLQGMAGVFFGLIVGLVVSYGLNLVVGLLFTSFVPAEYTTTPVYRSEMEIAKNADGTVMLGKDGRPAVIERKVEIGQKDHPAVSLTKLLVGIICCYFCVSFILQTKDDIRFVIPYVEFARQIKGQHPLILDTSVIIDGRIVDIAETGILDQAIVIPRFVLTELQAVADSNDKLKRNRGRRGLDVLHKLQDSKKIEVQVVDPVLPKTEAGESVDLKLLALARQINGRVATNDFNLNKLAQVRGIEVININDLANALKPVVLPGEGMTVKIIKPGEAPGQGVGYLDDGTMIVVEQGRNRIGETITFMVTSVLQTSAGRMIFGRIDDHGGAPPAPRRRLDQDEPARKS